MNGNQWYKDKVFYQIWPRSFKDGNGDGMGDLIGVYEKLNYIKSLGCDGIWFSPLYPSPGVDCGYDISDYLSIADEFGGMDAFRKVIDSAHEKGMKVIMDLVVNHTSTEHEWFEKSRRRIEPYTDYYIWRPAKPGGKLPNNWDSLFEGKAWAWDEVRQEYYMHLFAVEQADLNMDNPLVRDEVKKILKYWLDMGVDGFREDVITFISKKEGLPDDYIMPAAKGFNYFNHGPHLHEYLCEFRDDVLSKYDCMTLAEAPMIKPKKALKYIDEAADPVLDMMIQFSTQEADCLFTDFVHMPFSLRKLKKAWRSWQEGLEGRAWNMLYIENHDHPRIVSRYGSEKFLSESAKMLAVSYLFLKGTPFIYQGQEIGMSNWYPKDPSMYEDVQTRWQYENVGVKKSPQKRLERLWHGSRDSARTPVQWDSSENAGFTTGTPWFYVNENYKKINVASQEQDENSVLNFYRKAIKLRKELSCVRYGDYKEFAKHSSSIYLYAREDDKQKILVVCSFSEKNEKWKLPDGYNTDTAELCLCNYSGTQSRLLRPYEARVYLWNKQA
ncbi:MAG: alpha-glucosidase [Clostridia bacterium]|nr:alpha-glucosidase [Clostridia bacterium]